MSSTGPWWSNPTIVGFGGVLLGLVVSSSLTLLSERFKRRRLARDKKVAAYPAINRSESVV